MVITFLVNYKQTDHNTKQSKKCGNKCSDANSCIVTSIYM